MLKTVQIEICDRCRKEVDSLWDFTIPWPDTIVAMGGRYQKPVVFFGKDFYCKNIQLCEKCATDFARFLVNTSQPEGVGFEWEK